MQCAVMQCPFATSQRAPPLLINPWSLCNFALPAVWKVQLHISFCRQHFSFRLKTGLTVLYYVELFVHLSAMKNKGVKMAISFVSLSFRCAQNLMISGNKTASTCVLKAQLRTSREISAAERQAAKLCPPPS